MKIELTDRKSAALSSSRIRCLRKTPTVNLSNGCAHRCVYCFARTYNGHPGDGAVTVFRNTFDKLREELERREKLPAYVYFSPSSDLFQPVEETLDLAYNIHRYLLEREIGVAFLTKGLIPQRCLELYGEYAGRIRASIGLISLDDRIARSFEPGAPLPLTRLAQARTLIDAGVETSIRIDPVIPGLTDEQDAFRDLCIIVKATGASQLTLSTLGFRPELRQAIEKAIELKTAVMRFRGVYGITDDAPRDESNEKAFAPVEYRRKLYNDLQRIAEEAGLKLHICGCKNMDITAEMCRIDGVWQQGNA